jgi:hypothetical protein
MIEESQGGAAPPITEILPFTAFRVRMTDERKRDSDIFLGFKQRYAEVHPVTSS